MLEDRPARLNGLEKIVIVRVIAGVVARSCCTDPNSARPRSDFIYTENSAPQVGAMLMKIAIFIEDNAFCVNFP